MNVERRARDGVALGYVEAGAGDPPLVFIHGVTCDHTDFALQFEHFQPRHRVVAVDLRGHGASDTPAGEYAPSVFAADVAWLCTELGVERPIVIGHSMGGIVALELAASHSELVRAIVLLDSPIFVPDAYRSIVETTVEMVSRPNGPAAWRILLHASFSPLDDRARRKRILQRAGAAPQPVLASCFTNGAAWDEEAAARACKVPALYVRSSTFVDLERFRACCPRLVTGETVGAGHFAMCEVPAQIDSMLERFIAAVPS